MLKATDTNKYTEIKERIFNDEILEDYHMYKDLFNIMKEIKHDSPTPVFSLDECLDMLNKLLWQENRGALIDLAPGLNCMSDGWSSPSMNISILMGVVKDVLKEYVQDTNHKDNLDEYINKAETYLKAVSNYLMHSAEHTPLIHAPSMMKVAVWNMENDLNRTIKIIKGEDVPPKRFSTTKGIEK